MRISKNARKPLPRIGGRIVPSLLCTHDLDHSRTATAQPPPELDRRATPRPFDQGRSLVRLSDLAGRPDERRLRSFDGPRPDASRAPPGMDGQARAHSRADDSLPSLRRAAMREPRPSLSREPCRQYGRSQGEATALVRGRSEPASSDHRGHRADPHPLPRSRARRRRHRAVDRSRLRSAADTASR